MKKKYIRPEIAVLEVDTDVFMAASEKWSVDNGDGDNIIPGNPPDDED